MHLLNYLHGPGLQKLILTGGYFFLFAIIFAETGLLIGFFLPGDSLLFLAGAAAAQHGTGLSISVLLISLCVAAIIGNASGYAIGKAVGEALLHRPDSRLFKREYVTRTHAFFEKHGPKSIILARFVPIVRTFVTAIAGVGEMDFKAYMTYSVVGGIGWICSMTLLGYYLGGIKVVQNNLEKATLLLVFLSILPMIIHYFQERGRKPEAEPAATPPAI